MQESSRKETNLEERYGIMVGAEIKDGQSGNPRAEESFQVLLKLLTQVYNLA